MRRGSLLFFLSNFVDFYMNFEGLKLTKTRLIRVDVCVLKEFDLQKIVEICTFSRGFWQNMS